MAINPALKQLMAQKANKYKQTGNAKKLKEGRNVIRVIAPKPGEAPWVKEEMAIYRDLGVHWIKMSKDGKPVAVVGNSEICYDRPSEIAAAVDAAIASAYDEDSKELYQSWKARASVLVNLVDRTDDTVDVWELPKGVWGSIMDLWNLYAEQDFDIFDNQTGLDIAINRSGKGLNTKYDVQAMPVVPGKPFKAVTLDQVQGAKDLDAFIESNYFRGDEQKALNAIAQVSGIVIPRLGAPVTPTAALTSPAATVADAPIVQPMQIQQTQPDPAVIAAQEQARQAALLALQQQQLAQAAQQAPVTTPPVVTPAEVVPPQPTVTAQTGLSDLSAEQQDELLRQLAQIG